MNRKIICITTIQKYLACFISASLVLLTLSGCRPLNSKVPLSKSAVFFDTYITISLYLGGSEEILSKCLDLCDFYENLFSAEIPTSDIARINSAGKEAVKVSSETIYLIEKSIEYSRLTNGLYDITIYPVSKLWDFHGDSPNVPDEEVLKAALLNVDYNNIVIDAQNSTVALKNANASLDVGGIAKGYIADLIKEYLEDAGVTGALINLGGDISAVGAKSRYNDFSIGISDPHDENNIIGCAKINDMCIASSGTYERCFEAGGRKYHHILDPKTGYPAGTDIAGITVIAPNAIDADALCTASILMGSTEAISLINSLSDTECLIVKNDSSIVCSDNMEKFLSSGK